ncbi:hypothetical protein BGZ65_006235 [Modicella reniformis]|uniref:Crinkler effector protein N-terminal domain-containing protein n=1 Tax=Modicella reniformis TaxID=1440133 RepID=A0A9P6JHG2_9FUNG|nr:hypothetical protein BGZ65_006235 [Modicella reniformis]
MATTLTFFCAVDGDSTPFAVKAKSTDSVHDLKKAIKTEKTNDFSGKKLGPATRLSKVFPEELPEETIHIIVQRPPQGLEVIPPFTGIEAAPLSSDLEKKMLTQLTDDVESMVHALMIVGSFLVKATKKTCSLQPNEISAVVEDMGQ